MRLIVVAVFVLTTASAKAQELPVNEVQVAFNGYFDSFDVNIAYPTVSATRQVAENTSISARYLVDIISAASIRSRFEVDGVTSATSTVHGDSEGSPDEIRHEFGVGATQLVGRGTVSANLLRSVEHDYTSSTITFGLARSFAEQNTDVSFGLVRSWDEVYPQTRTWRRDKNVTTWSAGVSQVLGPRAIGQIEFTYSDLDGFLSDAYQVVTIFTPVWEAVSLVEPRHPGRRLRRAIGARVNVMTTEESSLRIGYRRYWDSWDVRSNTFDVLAQQHVLDRDLTIGIAFRRYLQSKAAFFEDRYTSADGYVTVDSKLNANRSSEVQIRLRAAGDRLSWIPTLQVDGLDLNVTATYYRRRTNSPDWHSRRDVLSALITSIGVRVRY